MSGPKYPGIVESHSYGPVGVKVRGEMVVTGPVYPADPANKFREPIQQNQKKNLWLIQIWFLPAAKHSRSITHYSSFPSSSSSSSLNHQKRAQKSKICIHLAALSGEIEISDIVAPSGSIMSKYYQTNELLKPLVGFPEAAFWGCRSLPRKFTLKIDSK